MNWDNEIDQVARQMTAGEPDAGFKARVLARIDRGRSRSRLSIWAWAPAAAIAIVIVAVAITVRLKPETRLNEPAATEGSVRVEPDPRTRTDPTYETPGSVRLKADPTYRAPGPVRPPSDSSAQGNPERSRGLKADPTYQARGGSFNVTARPTYTATGARIAARQPRLGSLPGIEPSELAPAPLEIDEIGVESMEAMESIEVPQLAVAQLEVPLIAEQ